MDLRREGLLEIHDLTKSKISKVIILMSTSYTHDRSERVLLPFIHMNVEDISKKWLLRIYKRNSIRIYGLDLPS